MRNGDAYFFNVTAEGAVTSNPGHRQGPGDGLFVYDGVAGARDARRRHCQRRPEKTSSATPTQGPGIAISAPGLGGGKNEIQIRPDLNAVLIYAP